MAITWHFLHGFWGSPEDFSETCERLRKKRSHDHFQFYDLRKENLKSVKDFKPVIENKKDFHIFCGYSMGGRILLPYCFSEKVHENAGFVFISTGLGLATERERKERALWETDIIKKMQSMSLEEFRAFWNSYGIFDEAKARKKTPDWSKEQLMEIFDRYRLSKGEYWKDSLVKASNVKVVLGEKDKKYLEMYKGMKKEVIKNASHRIPIDEPILLCDALLDFAREMKFD